MQMHMTIPTKCDPDIYTFLKHQQEFYSLHINKQLTPQ